MADPTADPTPNAHAPGGLSPTEMDRLVDKVYALMVAEARLGFARTESGPAPKRSVED